MRLTEHPEATAALNVLVSRLGCSATDRRSAGS